MTAAEATIDTIDGPLVVSEVTWQQINDDGKITGLIVADFPGGPLLTEEAAGLALTDDVNDYDRCVEDGCTWRPRRHDLAIAEMQEQYRAAQAERIAELTDVIRRVQANNLVQPDEFAEHLATVIVGAGWSK